MPTTLTTAEEQARDAWIIYSTPLWRRAGRSEQWIAQNIESEWISSKQDIIRRYLAGDFAEAVIATKQIGLGTFVETMKNYLPWVGLGVAGIILIIILVRSE